MSCEKHAAPPLFTCLEVPVLDMGYTGVYWGYTLNLLINININLEMIFLIWSEMLRF